MAEVTGLRNNVMPYPVYGAPWGVTFPILNASGDLVTGAAGLDSEKSLNGDTFADCTNEATEIATSSGMYYLLLTATELTTNVVTVIVKTSTVGAKTTPLVLYPRQLPTVRAGTAAGGAAGSITLDSGASAVDDFYNGAMVVAVIDSNVEARLITDYTGSTKAATVVPDWNVTPDSDDTFTVLLTDAMLLNKADARLWLGDTIATPTVAGVPEVDVTHWIGTAVATPSVAGVPEVDITHIDGLATSGNNATLNLKKLNIVNSAGDAILASATGGNGHGINATANGSGHGIRGVGGATGDGMRLEAGATSGDGLRARSQSGASSGSGIFAEGLSDDGDGLSCRATGGAGIFAEAQGGTSPGFQAGSLGGNGATIVGGGTGAGMFVQGGGTDGIGLAVLGDGSSPGTFIQGGATGNGLSFTGQGNGHGVIALGAGTGAGIRSVGGATGDGISAQGGATSGNGTKTLGTGSGMGFHAEGGPTDAYGIFAYGHGVNSVGLSCYSGDGYAGAEIVGGAGDGIQILGLGTNKSGLVATGDGTGFDINAPNSDIGVTVTPGDIADIVDGVWDEAIAGHLTAGSTGLALNSAGSAGDPWNTALPGAYASGTAGHIVGTGIPDIAPGAANGLLKAGANAATSITTALTANVIGNITGNLSGSVGSVTGAVGSVTGAVGSVTGNVSGNVTGSVGSVVGAVGSVTAAVTVGTNNDKTGYALSSGGVDSIWDDAVDGSVTARQSLRLANSANGGKLSGAATTNVLIRDLADTKNRVDATVTSDGDRTAITLDLT